MAQPALHSLIDAHQILENDESIDHPQPDPETVHVGEEAQQVNRRRCC